DIKLLTVNQQGSVLEKISDNEYLVQVGIMKVKVKRTDLQLMKKQKEATAKPIATIKGYNYHVSTELDLRGERYEDALLKLEKYIDDSLLVCYQKVSIMQGKGTGELRKGVHEVAKKHPKIASRRADAADEGGCVVTVIEFG